MDKLTLVFPLAVIAFILLVFSEYLPLLPKTPLLLPDRHRWTGRDSVLCLLITGLYAVAAFTGLGDTVGIQHFCKFQARGEYALIELKEATSLSALRYYPGLKMGNYYLQFSADGETYEDVSVLPQGHADLFKWKDAELAEGAGGSVRFVRFIADSPLWLGEIALYDGDGARIPPSAMLYPAGCAPLLDEQNRVPDTADFKNGTYFDEIYHARTAYENIVGEYPYEISHPPLGKLILSLGIRMFGMVPFGWRFMGTLFGVLMLPAIYLFLKKMFGGTLVPGCCTVIFAADFMHFVQTRIATIDTYAVFFTILMYLFFWLYWQADRDEGAPRGKWLAPLALSGLCFGLGAASKWTCIYAGGGLAVLWLLDRIFRGSALCRAGRGREYLRETAENVFWCLLFFVAVPCCIYYVSYWPYGTAKGMEGLGMLFDKDYFRLVIDNQSYMFSYHSGVNATHPYSSVWWQWILDVRPILYYLRYLDDGTHIAFGAWVNPMLCWGGLAAMLSMVYLSFWKRDRTALFILVGYLAQLLPWVFVSRVVFEYHYFPSTVFLLLALGHVFRTLELNRPRPRRVLFSFAAVTVVLFAVFYPVLAGLPVSNFYGGSFLKWLGSWPF